MPVICPDDDTRADLEELIRERGYGVVSEGHVPADAELAIVEVAFELTPREREILPMVLEGRSSKQIGRALGIRPKTVDDHIHRIMEKLEVDSRLRLAVKAVRLGLVRDEPGD